MIEKHARGVLLRLAGPLQSWGTHSKYLRRDTARFPTRSGVVGMLAAGLGREREAPLDDLTALSMTVRVDRPGVVLSDFHTVGGGLPADETVITVDGKRRSEGKGTLVSKRQYLADAAFTVALTSDDAELLHLCAAALRDPHWPLFLGRRSCPPEGPLLLGTVEDPLHHLVRLPLATKRPCRGPQPTDFYSDRPLGVLPVDSDAPDRGDGDHHSGEVTDEPLSFAPLERRYRPRPLYRRAVHLPDATHAGFGTGYLEKLQTYIDTHFVKAERSTR
ncbi:type I-E CRISPR-associated protein Cas5/CasD [Streptomyces albipurpureus]|uniref:Type I-E CRISPR-associated protein Cas5/CasD n=1 Tax=Streptomyces albipurpureus TaxID=2897419 RepID=A0ABT0UFJ2_9ACTN|nr:type I-E CRISPR-associated protein Cas5/CasD [Streptomyces sp. CWNU-1]MCM2387150.1 type I-E CRISPR-associated protein Cas5/CasD [Streptomyces sp. CWNU-1]